jgi:hypothetical protein
MHTNPWGQPKIPRNRPHFHPRVELEAGRLAGFEVLAPAARRRKFAKSPKLTIMTRQDGVSYPRVQAHAIQACIAGRGCNQPNSEGDRNNRDKALTNMILALSVVEVSPAPEGHGESPRCAAKLKQISRR